MKRETNAVLLCSFLALVGCSSLSPDSLKFYHDITSGKGLYTNFNKIISLNQSSFKNQVFDNTSCWLVEFYNSWCGHCHRFAPVWKRLALDVYNWRSVIKIGAVDCSNQANIQLCRQYEVMYYPTVKYFSKLSPDKFLGSLVDERTINGLRHFIVSRLQERSDLPQLSHYKGTSEDIWSGIGEKFIIAVIDNNSSFIGQELALDLVETKEVKVVVVEPSNADVVENLVVTSTPAIYLLEKHGNTQQVPIEQFTREDILSALDKLLKPKGLKMPKPIDYADIDDSVIDITQAISLLQIEDQVKKKLHSNQLSDTVFQVDIEGALLQSLYTEIPSKKHIEGEMFNALFNYIEIIHKFFPIGKNGIEFLSCIKQSLINKKNIDGADFYNLTDECQKMQKQVFLQSKERWLGCKGSKVTLRGYPCSLWTMFHTLTVQADLKNADDPKQVLSGMTGYIKYFFGCTECSKHFQEMATTMAGNVTSTESSILWLWKAHNSVNKRLSGDETEDPTHPKVQFPPQSLCKNCTNEGIWNDTAVLEFLRKMYSKISFIVIEDILPKTSSSSSTSVPFSKSLKHEVLVDEKDVSFKSLEKAGHNSLWDFNFFDISLCILLYFVSMAIILLVCFKFYKKTYRKKANYFDVFQKV